MSLLQRKFKHSSDPIEYKSIFKDLRMRVDTGVSLHHQEVAVFGSTDRLNGHSVSYLKATFQF